VIPASTRSTFAIVPLLFITLSVRAQDSVDVTFSYSGAGVTSVTVPGEANGWNTGAWVMKKDVGGVWTYTARMRVGGNPTPPAHGVPGAWQHKFFTSGANWTNDPLNHHQNPDDNNNSFIYTKDPTIYHLLPNQRQAIVTTSTPGITVSIFPKVGATVDTSTIQLVIDGNTYSGLGAFYDPVIRQLSYLPPSPLPNGVHTLILRAGSSAGGSNADTVTFVTQSGYVQISNQGGYTTRSAQRTLYGVVQNTSLTSVRIVRNGTDTVTVPVSAGHFTDTDSLVEGPNTFRALADSAGTTVTSSSVTFTRFVNHVPSAQITFQDNGSTIAIMGTTSTDPDPGQTATLTFSWSEDPANPSVIGGINGSTAPSLQITPPAVAGEYYVNLIAADADGNRDTTRNYFAIDPGASLVFPTIASVPHWVREGRMYLMFFKMHTTAGTINAATPDLDRIAAMGYNIIWVLPVMKNRDPINNGPGPGYNITDFYDVAPEYGTNQDFKNFVTRAHQLGMKVILDVTPNHTSSSHPFVLDARIYREGSRYWTYYQHQIIPYTGGGLGEMSQSITGDGFVYYGGFSDALLNYNWGDVDARQYMLDVYKYWINAMGVDGYRFDVYWGPFTRTNSPAGGETEMGQPVRQTLKHIRPDIHLLGEASGTGLGTERVYADYPTPAGGHGVDAAYDWNLKGYVQNGSPWSLDAATRVNNLDVKLRNVSANAGMGYMPGPNAYYLRFLENQDEDRISYLYGSGVDAPTARLRTMPMSTAVNLAVGMPLVYAGQEVGRGYGITDYDTRRRGVVDFSDPAGQILMPHYQKLAQIKKQFACFTTQQMVRVTSSVAGVYAYTRPLQGLNGLVVTNFDAAPHPFTVTLTSGGSPAAVLGVSDGTAYVATNLYGGGTTTNLVFTGGTATLTDSLPAYGSAVYVIDIVPHTLTLPSLTGVDEGRNPAVPERLALDQNYPNPFNPATSIGYELPAAGFVSLRIFDILGREVETLVNELKQPGIYRVTWNASRFASGMYFCRLEASGRYVDTKKMLLVK